MTCISFGGGIVCVNTGKLVRFHVGNRYIWMEWHNYLGPCFFTDYGCTKAYDPVDENDPIWPEFEKWHTKRKEKESRCKS